MTVTVCIPAYRAGSFIAETVSAVLRQTHDDLKVIVAIDPPADGTSDDTAAALAAFAADPRLSVRTNPKRLGWAENVNSLVPDITTPFFCFQPHDDVWAPNYLESMLAALNEAPHAVTAYCDILRFGASRPTRKSVTLPPGADRVTALLHFLIQGTEAQMWRGVTRSNVFDRIKGFPTDGHRGLVVECEYALALFGVGAICHVPRTYYFKRIYDKSVISASRERMLQPLDECKAGWKEHDRRMQALLSVALDDMQADATDRMLCESAKEAALLRRYQQFVTQSLGDAELERAESALARLGARPSGPGEHIAANLHLVIRNHWRAAGFPDKAEASGRAAWQAGKTYESALLHAQTLHKQNRPLEALERATEAIRIGHLDDTGKAEDLIDRLVAELGWGAAK